MSFITMIQCKRANCKGKGNHSPFKKVISDYVYAKQRKACKNKR